MSIRLRIATFNLENLDNKPDSEPTLAERITVIRPQLIRLNADVLCLQEVNGQEAAGEPRQLLALKQLFEDTPYLDYYLVSTKTADGEQVYNERNLVILSRFEILNSQQFKGKYASFPLYQQITAIPKKTQAERVDWERPIFHAQIELPDGNTLEVINLHFKSKLPSRISGQKKDRYSWKSASGWAEGFFLSALKRVGQALETRIFIDSLFNDNQDSSIAVCGDFNAEADETPVEAIRGDIENTNNSQLSSRYSLFHRGKGVMLDHILISRSLLQYFSHAEIHNELLHDESIAFAFDKLYPESDRAPVIAEFELK